MISYLNEQPRTQMLADALRGGQPMGGSEMAPRQSTPMGSNPALQMPDFNQYGSSDPSKPNLGDVAKKGWDVFKQSDTGKSMIDSLRGTFGGTAEPAYGSIGGSSAFGGASAAEPAYGSIGGSNAFGGAGAGGGFMSSAGPLAAMAAASYGTDKLLNESDKDKWYNADKINSYGTFNVGGKDIGLRGGDFVNAINPATWLSDPNKAQKGLLNAFTLGIFD